MEDHPKAPKRTKVPMVSVTFRLPESDHAQLEWLAYAWKGSVSSVLQKAVDEYLDARKAETLEAMRRVQKGLREAGPV